MSGPMKAWQTVVISLVTLLFVPALWAQGKGKSVEPLPQEKLFPFLKEFKGWKAEEPPEGQSIKTPAGTYTEASRYYTQGGKDLDVTIRDCAHVSTAYEDFEDLKQDVGKGPNPPKATKIAGHDALELFEPKDQAATLMVKVKNRFLVFFELTGATPKDDLKVVANQLDWKALEALASSGK